MEQKFFLYARKSTDVEDKQVLSIEAQLTELRAFAKQENLNVVEELVEKQSAKIPGRKIFNDMVKRIEQGEAQGILAWNPDRLARNSVDGGRIIYLVDCGHLLMLKFPTFWFENTSQGKFMLNIAFGQSKYYVDSLSENTKRGLRQKVRMGIFPSQAPIGYINDSRTKTIVVDKKQAKIVRLAFEKYTKGNMRLEDVANFLAKNHITTRSGKIFSKTKASFILSNPFYIGLFKYSGEIHEGKHEPIISKKLFDSAQEMLKTRGRPDRKPKNEPQAFCGLIHCAECGMLITGETQKGHIYYRCSKKSKTIQCTQKYVREEEIDRQLSSLIQKVSLPKDWAEELLKMAQKDYKNSAQSNSAFVEETKKDILKINIKLERLLNGYLDQVIEQDIYRVEKGKLLFTKKSLEAKISSLLQKQNNWLEPFQNWIKDAQNIDGIARDTDLFAKKVCAKEIFGSNLLLGEKTVRTAEGGAGFRTQNSLAKTGETAWAALCAAHSLVRSKPIGSILVRRVGFEPTKAKAVRFTV